MSRRKGERPIVKAVKPYTADHPVAGSMRRGSRWLDAWVMQMVTPWAVITRKTGIAPDRISAFQYGDAQPTDEEVEKLAALWYVTPEGLRASIASSPPRRA